MLRNEYEKALELLLKVKLKGNKKNAIKYYELTLQYSNEQTKEYAQEQIDELKKN